ncbi:MAG: methyltransferase type 11 [Planctomycetaceae bacterium]|nr:methyltransferase type 11 [Planctomycetaceae bacterium]
MKTTITFAILSSVLVASLAQAEDAKKSKDDDNPRYTRRAIHDRNGIGKFYLGREIAHVMGYQGIPWLERPEREKEEGLKKMVESFKLKPGMVVADIGAGSGVITLRMAKQVGAKGKIIAVDVQQQMLDALNRKLKRQEIKNVELVKGTQKSPKLKPNSVDLIIMVDVYHEFEFPYEMTIEMAKSLKPGGRICFVEYRMEDPAVPIKLVHKMSEKQVKKEALQKEFHLKFKETVDVLPWQHMVFFERKKF